MEKELDHHKISHNLKDSTFLWRYMDISKFSLLITQKKIWFSRSDLLGDDHEGSLPESIINERKLRWSDLKVLNVFERGSKEGRKDFYINCWTLQNPKSLSMWKIYTPNAVGVAVKTSIGRLANCFVKKPNDLFERNQARIEKVTYIDYSTHKDNNEEFDRFIHKQKAYSYEKEIRFLIFHGSTINKPPIGKNLEVDLEVLIDEIYISQQSGEDLHQYIEELLNDHGINKKIVIPPFARTPSF